VGSEEKNFVSAAFQLDFTGPQTRCDYPGCIGDAFHDGEHRFAPKKREVEFHYDRHCIVCGASFMVIGAPTGYPAATCGDQACIERYARHHTTAIPVTCSCAQRPYPHELAVHTKIGAERVGVYFDYYDNAIRFAPEGMRWPWSLRHAPKMEG
jgi:hypothetical protein